MERLKLMVKKRKSTPRRATPHGGNPYPSSPQRPPTINILLKWGEGFSRLTIHCLCQRWAAKISLDVAINDREYEGPDEMGWYITDDGELMFKLGGDVHGLLDEDHSDNDWVPIQPEYNDLLVAGGRQPTLKKAEEPEKKTRVPKKNQPRGAVKASRGGLVTLAEICAEINMEPRDARKKLRGKVDKPDAGWAWPADEADDVRKVLK